MNQENYFFIDWESIAQTQKPLTFDLFLFRPLNGSFIIHTMQDQQVDPSLFERELQFAVLVDQYEQYLEYTGLKMEDVPSLQEKNHPLFILANDHKEEFKASLGPYDYYDGLRDMLTTNDFTKINLRTKAELCQFPFNHSHLVSLAHQIGKAYIHDEKRMNKNLSLCFYFAMLMGLKDMEELSHLMVANFYRHIGLTQSSQSQDPALSLFVLSKSNLNLPTKTLNLIRDYKELYDGSGLPSKKRGEQIEMSAQIIGLCDHLVNLAEDKPMIEVFKSDLKLGFHPKLLKLIQKITSTLK